MFLNYYCFQEHLSSGDQCSEESVDETVNISLISTERRQSLFAEILDSDEILLSLIYSNGTTQLRDQAAINNKVSSSGIFYSFIYLF